MKKWILHIMLVGVLGMLAASCSQDADSPLQTEGKKVQVTFTLGTGGQDAYSRSTWEGYDGDGEGDADATFVYGGEAFDNKIDPDQLQVLICDNDCKPIAKVQRLLHTKEGNNVYKFTGSFVATISPTSYYKIMVFANCPIINPTIPSTSVVEPVVAEMPGNTADLTAIPMWGVQQIIGANLLAGNSNLTIYVLRALAKVEIEISAEGYTLESASFKKYNEKINCIPNGFNSVASTTVLATETLTSGDNTIPASFNPNVSQPEGGLAFATIQAGKKLVAYVPEYENTDTDNLEMTVIVKKTDDNTVKSYDVPFKYSVTAVGDVIRNYYYTYNITAVNTAVDVPLTLEYMVMDWNTVTNPNLTFGNSYGNANGESVPDEEPQDPSQGENTQNGSGNVTQ